jgi:hypothetical protein
MRKSNVANLAAASVNTLLCGGLVWQHHRLLTLIGSPDSEQIASYSRFEAAMFAYVLAIFIVSYVTPYKRLSFGAQVVMLFVALANLRIDPPYVLGTALGGIVLILADQFAPARHPYRWWPIVSAAALGSAVMNFFIYRGVDGFLYRDGVAASVLALAGSFAVGWILRTAESRSGLALMVTVICGVLTPFTVLIAH